MEGCCLTVCIISGGSRGVNSRETLLFKQTLGDTPALDA
jgi:hypothetical protein